MPRTNPLRTIDSEAVLAARVAFERESRGWSYERMAELMGDAGCPIQASAIFKIEKGRPRRRITVDELVGFSAAFAIPTSDLLTSPDSTMRALFEEWDAKRREVLEVSAESAARFDRMAHYVQTNHDSVLEPFSDVVEAWAAAEYPDGTVEAENLKWTLLEKVVPIDSVKSKADQAFAAVIKKAQS